MSVEPHDNAATLANIPAATRSSKAIHNLTDNLHRRLIKLVAASRGRRA